MSYVMINCKCKYPRGQLAFNSVNNRELLQFTHNK